MWSLLWWLDGGVNTATTPAYPELRIDWSSRKIPRDGRTVSQEGDGKSRIRKVHDDKADFALVHSRISTADREALLAFYDAHPLEAFTFLWPPEPDSLFTVKFAARPQLVERKGDAWTYEVKLVAGA